MESQNYRFDIAKTILMLMVVIQHSFVSFTHATSDSTANIIRIVCLGFSMPLFAFISGWFAPISFDLHRWLRMFWLCLLFDVVGRCSASYFWGRSFVEVAPAMWYMWSLLIFRTVAPLIKKPAFLSAVSVVVSWSACYLPSSYQYCFLGRIIGIVPFFALGFTVSRSKHFFAVRNLVQSSGNWKCVLAFLFLEIGFIVCVTSCYPDIVKAGVSHSLIAGGLLSLKIRMLFQFFALVAGALFLLCLPRKRCWISELGERTLSVYLLHVYIVVFFVYIVCRLPLISSAVGKFVAMMASVLLSLLLYSDSAMRMVVRLASVPERMFWRNKGVSTV